MSEHNMARFGQGYVQTNVISENNSVKYKLEFGSGVEFSTPSDLLFTFQDEPIGVQPDGVGINIREYNPANHTTSQVKTFLLTAKDTDPGNLAFLEYITTIPANNTLLLFTTKGRIYVADNVAAQLAKMGSVSFPSKWQSSTFYCYFTGAYSIQNKSFVAENVSYSSGTPEPKDIRPTLEFVYDKLNDIGATGFPKRPVEDPIEYVIDSTNINKRYPAQNEQVSLLKNYGLSPNDKVFFSVHLNGAQSLVTAGQNLRANLRWFNGTSYLSGISVETNPATPGVWAPFERYTTVPADATGFTIIVSRTPDIVGSIGTGAVRAMMLARVSRAVEPLMDPASIGVNGIRMNNAISTGVDPDTLLVLPDTEDDKSGNIFSADFREFQ